MGFIDEIKARAKADKKIIVLPETEEIAVFAIFLPALAESGPAPAGRDLCDAICGALCWRRGACDGERDAGV